MITVVAPDKAINSPEKAMRHRNMLCEGLQAFCSAALKLGNPNMKNKEALFLGSYSLFAVGVTPITLHALILSHWT